MIRQRILQIIRKASMKRALPAFLALLGLVSIAVLALGGNVGSAQAVEGVSVKDIEGQWAFSTSGFIADTNNPFAALGTLNFDDNGGCTFSGIINAAGTIENSDFPCDYILGADGFGEITAVDAPFTAMLFHLGDKDDEFHFSVTGPSSKIAIGVAERPIIRPVITAEALEGVWGFSASGFNVGQTNEPVVASGAVTFDGNGGCFFSTTFNAGGTVSSAEFACNYTMNEDGTGEITAVDAAFISIPFVLGNQLHFIVTGPNSNVVSGAALPPPRPVIRP